MNIERFCKEIRKDSIYEYYINVIRNPKDYDKISRKKMCLDVLNYIKENRLENLITYDEYEPLCHLVDNLYLEEEKDIYKQLCNRFLVTYDLFESKIVILDEFKEIIKKKILMIDRKVLKSRKEKDMIIGGIIKAHGILPIGHLMYYLNHYFPDDSSISSFTDIDYYLQFYDYQCLSFNGFILDKRFIFDFNDLYNAHHHFDDMLENNHMLSKKALFSIYHNNFDLNIKSNKELYDRINVLPRYLQKDITEKILLYTHIQAIIDKDFLSDYSYYEEELKDLLPIIKKSSKNIPSALFHGLTEKQFLKKYPRKPKENNAKVTTKDAFLFFKIFFGLLEYTNNKYHLQPKLKRIYEQTNLPPELVVPIRDYLFEHLEIIDEFIKKNPYHFNIEELQLVHNFKYSLSDTFIIMEYDNDFAYLLGRNGNFAVKGLHNTIEEVIPKSALPYVSPMNLIPFKDVIIYDGIFATAAIGISNNIKKILKDDFKKNITYYSIDCGDNNKFLS